ncbi:F-box/FBD/LRR-repeat protein At1g13570-like [Rutidosis leptorrhynchoides]|uniref:F-box/FBD/LRR-repeat protein At1g13570-like n=1 Tax=Rutidosis leptorrhynchoides TaxID=125765 RepID=UPI003A9A202C
MKMKLARSTHKASKVVLEDVINSMPDNVVTNILDRLPIQYAVRTAILSKKWRFKWNMLTHLVLDGKFYEYLVRLGIENWYDVRNINRLLLHLKGPITKFVLYIPNDKVFDVDDINTWVMFLSRKGLKEFTLKNMHVTPKLSSHIFSCVNLENLTLHNCSLCYPPTFCGLPNLLCLDLYRVAFENGSLGEIIIRSPSLEILKFNHIGKIKLVEIAKLKNLKNLLLPLCLLGQTIIKSSLITSSLIPDIGSYLPNLQVLFLDFQNCVLFGYSVSRKRVSTSFPCLKSLTLHQINFSSEDNLLFVFEMILYSPKLQSLLITAKHYDAVTSSAFLSSKLNHIKMGLAQLRNVVLQSFQGSENEILLVKKLLAGSPSLKNIGIYPKSSEVFGGDNGKLIFTKLLKFHRASPTAEVDIYWS